MRPAEALRSGQMIARSLRITGTTHTLVVVVSAAVALNASVAMQYLGLVGQVVLLAVVFASLSLGSLAISRDVYSRSGQAVANLRSIGATGSNTSRALAVAIVGYGIGGAALGAFAGSALSFALGAGTGAVSTLSESLAVMAAAAGATAAGFYEGARMTWRS